MSIRPMSYYVGPDPFEAAVDECYNALIYRTTEEKLFKIAAARLDEREDQIAAIKEAIRRYNVDAEHDYLKNPPFVWEFTL